ncbi:MULTISPECIES: GNAT family N-acetyltransferase [unclassified Acinetobacter]|uniref:GNAT family N-acetyltransferase n=1 Tax=unclassified Acinetobacter TaxID=196816 RepID=UPI0015D272FB|nr:MULTISPECIES: GNAT family N-acetyltransferase [unclassified Acinetobacter]
MIREAQIQDIPEIIHVIHNSIRSCIQDHQRNESVIQTWLEEANQSNILMWMLYNDSWVYVSDNRVVGFILVSDQGQILLNYICPERQYQGIGKALLLNMIHCVRKKNITEISLESTHTALAFYQKYGFVAHQDFEPADVPLKLVKQLC